ncbi:hypothetical protein Y1Q_0016946 [Alligator mississippiensis]|uniref:Uncharacterized protein n=1 Tax=Alligator mississippiensis TaxID=8496 RepID=A0A151NKK0_ALLMI|nr:hypothetical protein Y1Q_0016946 [Alligator mississippiensis]
MGAGGSASNNPTLHVSFGSHLLPIEPRSTRWANESMEQEATHPESQRKPEEMQAIDATKKASVTSKPWAVQRGKRLEAASIGARRVHR